MSLNEKFESIVYRAWVEKSKTYFIAYNRNADTEWESKNSLIWELENYFGIDWYNYVKIHEIKITHERVK